MKQGTITFSECEHDGDLAMYVDDLRESGATIISCEVNASEETGEVTIEIEDFPTFFEKFKKTGSYDFSNLV